MSVSDEPEQEWVENNNPEVMVTRLLQIHTDFDIWQRRHDLHLEVQRYVDFAPKKFIFRKRNVLLFNLYKLCKVMDVHKCSYFVTFILLEVFFFAVHKNRLEHRRSPPNN